MDEPRGIELGEVDEPRSVETPRPRAVGSPLAMGGSGRAVPAAAGLRPNVGQAAGSPGSAVAGERTLTGSTDTLADAPTDASTGIDAAAEADELGSDQPSSLQRAIGGLRSAWPFVQKILPLLDGQVITAISNLLSPAIHAPAQQVNLAPMERGLTELQTRHGELRDQVAGQNTSLKRVEDRLEMVREATDRNTLEQQELMEDLKKVGRKVNLVAGLALVLLAVSIAVNVVLYLHIQRVLP
jgi:hypothetical protein